jgi:hypothetical protein
MRRWLVLGFAILIAFSSLGCKALARKLTRRSARPPSTYDYDYREPTYTSPTYASASAPPATTTSIFGGAIEKRGDWWSYSQETPAAFSALLPGAPKESTENIPSEIGLIPQRQAMSSHGSSEVYILAWMDFPGTNVIDPKGVLDGARNGAVANVPSGKLRYEKNIKLSGKYPGREIVIDVTSPIAMVMTGHIYVVGRRFYQLQVVVPKGGVADAPMDKFFSSLTVR